MSCQGPKSHSLPSPVCQRHEHSEQGTPLQTNTTTAAVRACCHLAAPLLSLLLPLTSHSPASRMHSSYHRS